MNVAFRSRIRIAAVTTRELSISAGRPNVLSSIIRALQQHDDVRIFRLRNVIELHQLWDIAGAFLSWLWGLVRGRPLPLQCLLYASPRECARLADQIRSGAFDAVYLDTVRCQVLLRYLRRAAPQLHIVTDFDDLMSRRAEHLTRNRHPLLAGHIGRTLPRWMRYFVEGPLARLIPAYEAATLKGSEKEVVASSNAVVLLSTVECYLLRSRLEEAHKPRIHAIPPAVKVRAQPWMSSSELRFVFIGSDNFLQNRRAIDHLLERWRTLTPSAQLHIFGRQARPAEPIAGVHWHGFVEDLAEVYKPGSISLLPALVSGGIKTKVAEAWAWGCPVLGNAAALEGFALSDYPLALPETEWDPILVAPAAHDELWPRAARLGQDFVRRHLSCEAFETAWERTMRPVMADAVMLPAGRK